MNIVKMAPIKRKSPKTGKVAWYLQKRKYDTISSKELVEAMARNTGIPVAKVAMATDAIVKQLKNFLLNGHSVNIIGLGTFSPRIKSRPSETKDQVTAENVKALLLKFRPQTDIREDMKNTVGYEVIHSDVTGTAPAPVPEDPRLGITEFQYFSDGEIHTTPVTTETTTVTIPKSATYVGVKADQKGGKFRLSMSFGSFNLKRATGAYKETSDYCANGLYLSQIEGSKVASVLYVPANGGEEKTANFSVTFS